MSILVVTLCAGLTCMDAEWPMDGAALPFQCSRTMAEVVPAWIERHPGFTVRRYKCVPAAKVQREA